MATKGIESSLASAIAVRRLVAPGPEVARHTPTLLEDLEIPWAMKPAPCSCLGNICLILLLYSASYIGRLKPPGIPAIYSTPCFSKSFTNISAPLYYIKKLLLKKFLIHKEEEG